MADFIFRGNYQIRSLFLNLALLCPKIFPYL